MRVWRDEKGKLTFNPGIVGLFDPFKRQGAIHGLIVPHGIPPHTKSIVSVCFFKVASQNAPHPFDGNPPAEAMIDTVDVRGAKDPLDKPLRFQTNRAPGFYHIQVTYIAFFSPEQHLAQLERFFPNDLPSCVSAGKETTTKLEFWWPDIPIEDLGSYGVFRPGKPFTPPEDSDESASIDRPGV